MIKALNNEFQRIKKQHSKALRKTAARVVLGPSVMRVYARGTRDALLPFLPKLDVDMIAQFKSQEQFSSWFDGHVDRIAKVVDRCNPCNPRIRPGLKWGHATKIMALYVRDLVLSSRYFSDAEAAKISPYLHVPIDSIVIDRLRKLGVQLPFTMIKEIDTREKFYGVQKALASAAFAHNIPRVWFDDNWGDRQ
ncbi:MAG: hypothetical protein ACRER1_03600 [Gammaproteobacteria bacterium]